MAPVLDGSHWFDKTILFHHRSDQRAQRTHAVANLLRQMQNDVAILLPNSFRAAWVAWMAGIPRRIGYVRYGRGMLLTDGLKPPRDPTGKLLPTPIVEYYLALARVLGCRGGSIQLELATTPSDESAADRAWNQFGLAADERLVCLNTGGAFGPAKNWPAAYFAELARRLTRETGVAVLVLCGPAEHAAAAEIARLADHPRVVSLSEQPLSLGLSKACVRRAALLITTDSGPRHFAAAFQTPVITLFGPTHIAWTRTSHPRALHLFHPVPCGPCQKHVCPAGHHRCMRELTPDHVLRATLSLLGTEGRSQERQASWFGTRNISQRIGGPSAQPRRRGGRLRPETILSSGTGGRDHVMATWLITGATGFLGRHVLDVLDSELLRGSNRRCRPRTGTALSHGLAGAQLCQGRSGRSDRSARSHRESRPGPCHPHGRPDPTSAGRCVVPKQFLGDDPSAQRPAQLEPPGARDAGRFHRRVGARSSIGLAGCRVVSLRTAWAYGRSKLLATIAGLAERPPLELAVARVFNPIGPGMPPTQAFGEFAAQLTAGAADPLPLLVGDLEVRRDFVDVRDVARALVAVSLRGQPRLVYHVGCGQSRSVGEGLDLLVRLSGRSVKVCVDPRRHVRKGPDDSRADIRHIISHTGWRPTIPFEQSLADLWNDLRKGWDRSGPEVATRLPLTA